MLCSGKAESFLQQPGLLCMLANCGKNPSRHPGQTSNLQKLMRIRYTETRPDTRLPKSLAGWAGAVMK